MPEEVFILALLSIAAGTLVITSIVRNISKYMRARHGATQGSSMTTSELEKMLRRVVEESTETLHERIDKLEEGQLLLRDQGADPSLLERPGIEEQSHSRSRRRLQ